ncbi:MAG: hypothetical protein KKH88_04785 [Nanoarchaeota archaeon]|nr:hypothetical protein [Nanoarchaeota archaeon]
MDKIKFEAIATKGNNKGAGFIRIPLQIRNKFSIKDQYKIRLNSKIIFYSKIRNYRGNGIFIPTDLNIKNKLYKQKVEVQMEKINGFFTKVGSDGRIYIPNFYNLKNKDIILINITINKNNFKKICVVNSTKRKKTKELMCMLGKGLSGKKGIFKIGKKFDRNKLTKSSKLFKKLLINFNFVEINKNNILVFYGNHNPFTLNKKINLNEFAHYLGCYFSDGTKKGNHWAMSASTFEQANYFKEKHKKIILDSNIAISLTYTNYQEKDLELLKNKLIKKWSKKTGLILKNKKIRIIKTKTKYAPNRNPYGSLRIREDRKLVQIYYNRLLNHLLNTIYKENDKVLAFNFICGVMEGDGCVNSKTHSHIIISTNSSEIEILKKVCDKNNIKSSVRRWENDKYDRVDLVIGSLEIIKNISILKDKLFKYYPKRRKILQERLGNTGCAKFLLGKNKKTSNWLIGQLNQYKILDGKGNLTKFGKKVRKDLKEFLEKPVTVE